MNKTQCDLWAEKIVNELIFNDAIAQQKKTIFVNKISDFLFEHKKDYSEFQNRKVLKKCVAVYQQGKGDGLLEFIKNTNNVVEQNILEDKKQGLSGAELKAHQEKEFLSMSFNDQIDKATGWLTCSCPESSIPKFVISWVKGLSDKSLLDVMRKNFKIGRDQWASISGTKIVKGLNV